MPRTGFQYTAGAGIGKRGFAFSQPRGQSRCGERSRRAGKIGTQTFFRQSDCWLGKDGRAKTKYASLFFLAGGRHGPFSARQRGGSGTGGSWAWQAGVCVFAPGAGKNRDANFFSPERLLVGQRRPCEKKVCVPIFLGWRSAWTVLGSPTRGERNRRVLGLASRGLRFRARRPVFAVLLLRLTSRRSSPRGRA